MQAEGGAAGFVDIVARLLERHLRRPRRTHRRRIAGEIVSGLTELRSTLEPPPDPLPLRGGARGGGQLAPRRGAQPPDPFPGTT